jgi:hypothetical protein
MAIADFESQAAAETLVQDIDSSFWMRPANIGGRDGSGVGTGHPTYGRRQEAFHPPEDRLVHCTDDGYGAAHPMSDQVTDRPELLLTGVLRSFHRAPRSWSPPARDGDRLAHRTAAPSRPRLGDLHQGQGPSRASPLQPVMPW